MEGLTWVLVLSCDYCDMAYFPTDPSILLVTRPQSRGISRAGVYRSTDGGWLWSFSFAGPFAADTLVNRHDGHRAIIGNAYLCGGGRFFRTRDLGVTWKEQATPSNMLPYCPSNLAVSATNPDLLYYGYSQNVLYVSTDGGATIARLRPKVTSRFTSTIAASPCPERVVFRHGRWTVQGRRGSAEHHCAEPGVGSMVEFYSIAASPGDPDLLVGGTQDNGLIVGGTSAGGGRYLGGATRDKSSSTPTIGGHSLSTMIGASLIRARGLNPGRQPP